MNGYAYLMDANSSNNLMAALPPASFCPPPKSSSFSKLNSGGSGKNSMTELPSDFQPNAYSVMCGRGNSCFNYVGNRRFRVIATMFMAQYSTADSKLAKSKIVSQILDMIESSGGGFVKKNEKNGKWYEVSEAVAREKIGSQLRDCLHSQYKSSAKSKLARKAMMKKAREESSSASSLNSSDASSCGDAPRACSPEHGMLLAAFPATTTPRTTSENERPCRRVTDTELISPEMFFEEL